MKASRVYSGPEVRGTRPVLVTFETFKDRDEVLRKVSSVGFNEFVSIILLSQARLLKKANVFSHWLQLHSIERTIRTLENPSKSFG